jgi:hypothetical protein
MDTLFPIGIIETKATLLNEEEAELGAALEECGGEVSRNSD